MMLLQAHGTPGARGLSEASKLHAGTRDLRKLQPTYYLKGPACSSCSAAFARDLKHKPCCFFISARMLS